MVAVKRLLMRTKIPDKEIADFLKYVCLCVFVYVCVCASFHTRLFAVINGKKIGTNGLLLYGDMIVIHKYTLAYTSIPYMHSYSLSCPQLLL